MVHRFENTQEITNSVTVADNFLLIIINVLYAGDSQIRPLAALSSKFPDQSTQLRVPEKIKSTISRSDFGQVCSI
jgi:hypothetical protein